MHHEISSSQNPFVKHVLALQKKRERKKEAQFLLEGFSEISLAAASSYQIESLVYCPDFFRASERTLIANLEKRGTSILVCNETVFRKISYRDTPDGVLAIVKSQYLFLNELVFNSQSFFLILESLEKPGNLGAILRSADAAGAAGVIVVDEGVDLYNPNVIRASVGALFTVPTVVCSNEECLYWLKAKKIASIAATPEACISYTDFSVKGPIAFVMGREHEGLSSFWKKNADHQVKIPMVGKVDSLNVSVTSALLLFEAKRWTRK